MSTITQMSSGDILLSTTLVYTARQIEQLDERSGQQSVFDYCENLPQALNASKMPLILLAKTKHFYQHSAFD